MTASPSQWQRRLRSAEAAAYIGVSLSTIRAWRLRGPDDPNAGPRFIRLSGSMVVYDLADLDDYLARKRAATDAAMRQTVPPEAA